MKSLGLHSKGLRCRDFNSIIHYYKAMPSMNLFPINSQFHRSSIRDLEIFKSRHLIINHIAASLAYCWKANLCGANFKLRAFMLGQYGCLNYKHKELISSNIEIKELKIEKCKLK